MRAPTATLRNLSPADRLERVAPDLSQSTREGILYSHPPLDLADQWIENAIGYFSLPLGIVDHLIIDGIARIIPLATEETSIIAAMSSTAKWIAPHGGVTTETRGVEAIGQIHFPRIRAFGTTESILRERNREILDLANRCVPGLVARGGGFTRIEIRSLPPILVVHLYCDTRDAMGANLINQACEIVAPEIAKWIGEPCGLRILSNLVDTRRSAARIRLEKIDPGLANRIAEASQFAELDPYRAATHNKGIMNGIDGVLIATGNDWRAVEAGAHAYAARSGSYQPLSRWRSPKAGVLEGELDLPIALGTVGGVTRTHPTAAACLELIGSEMTAPGLARIVAGVGLVQNLAALRALASEGIVAGHMRLHLKNLILASDALPAEREPLLARLEETLRIQRRISSDNVREALRSIRAET